jgi:hypothetical protein
MDSLPLLELIVQATAVNKAIKMLRAKRAKVDIAYTINTRNRLLLYNILNLLLGSKVIV